MRTELQKVVTLQWPPMARVVLSAAAMLGVAYAQAGATFEVTPVAGDRIAGISRTPLRIAFPAAHVPDILAFAYGSPLDRIERRPQWTYDNLYAVAVTTAAPTGLPEQRLLLQKLLQDRFGLVTHGISTHSPVYFLVAGPKVNLTKTTDSDTEDLTEELPEVCTFRTAMLAGGYALTNPFCLASHASMNDLATWLYSRVKLPVLDKTGITGLFDIEIHGLPARGGAEGTIQAVRNSLGLNLELHPGTADSLIIDQIEKPKGN
jgi:uncharacterized protein (TIGR03435 family)